MDDPHIFQTAASQRADQDSASYGGLQQHRGSYNDGPLSYRTPVSSTHNDEDTDDDHFNSDEANHHTSPYQAASTSTAVPSRTTPYQRSDIDIHLRHFPSVEGSTLRPQRSHISRYNPFDLSRTLSREHDHSDLNRTVVELDRLDSRGLPSASKSRPMSEEQPHKLEHSGEVPEQSQSADQLDDGDELFDDAISELTLAGPPGDGPFDLEKFLRKLMKQ
ncbi:hypothetical protein BC835DRAFT_1076675 [Cytidiella melzeri]|nr:hypothetical protein BC835DRAFT_1076675 [Cytidiella melzeri]